MATPSKVTLLDLVQAVSDYATNDDEIVATVVSLINSGKVLLCGNFAGARIDLSVPAGTLRSYSVSGKVHKSLKNKKFPLRSPQMSPLPLLTLPVIPS